MWSCLCSSREKVGTAQNRAKLNGETRKTSPSYMEDKYRVYNLSIK